MSRKMLSYHAQQSHVTLRNTSLHTMECFARETVWWRRP